MTSTGKPRSGGSTGEEGGQLNDIDLGELPPSGADPGLQPPDHSGWLRAWLGAALAAVLLVSMPAAAPPSPPWAVHQFTATGQLLAVDDNALYLLRHRAHDLQTLVAHPVSGEGPSWEVTRDAGRQINIDDQGRAVMHHAWFILEGGLPLHVTTTQVGDPHRPHQELGRVWRPDSAVTTAFDPATGRVLWTRHGLPIGTTPEDLLLIEDWADGTSARGKVAVHARSGEAAWSISKPPGERQHDQHVLANHSEDGHLTTYDLMGGSRMATVQTGLAPTEGAVLLDDLVVLWERSPGHSVVAYGADDLALRWSVDVSLGSLAGACRTVVCLYSPFGVLALDPSTGAELWSTGWLPQEGQDHIRRLASRGRQAVHELTGPESRGRLLLEVPGAPGHESRTLIVDGHTGEQLLDISGWQLPFGHGEDLLVWRPQWQETWFGRLTADPPGLEVLGSLGSATHCVSSGSHLACQTGSDVEVWLLRR